MKLRNKFFLLLFSIIPILFGGCSSSSESVRPMWIDQGSGLYNGEKGIAFYGVGTATGIQNVQLRRTVAGTNARAELVRSIKVRLFDLVKIYARYVSNGDPNISNEEQTAQAVTESFTDTTISNASITNFYYSESEQTLYALAIMDASIFKDQLSQTKRLNPRVQDAILKNSEKAFKELYDKIKTNK